MGHLEAAVEPAVRSVRVRSVRREIPAADPLSTYRALTQRYGNAVCLLESAAGPEDDCREQLIGFRELLAISVSRGAVRLSGETELVEIVSERIAPLVSRAFGETRLINRRALWDVLRAVSGAFESEASATEFTFGFFSYFGYDAVHYIEDLPYRLDQLHAVPDVHLVLYQATVHTDIRSGRTTLTVHDGEGFPAIDADELAGFLPDAVRAIAAEPPEPEGWGPDPVPVRDDTVPDTYFANVDRCLEHIAVGDIYQVQIGHELTIHSDEEPAAVYRRLRERNPSPYMYLAPVGPMTIVGASPELFVRVTDGHVAMRPIAGTAPRTGDDEAVGDRLRSDPKEIAEHVMLVDLCRNDIGRICQRDSLDVTDEMVVARYSHVLHLVSTVVGKVAPDLDAFDVIPALFPAGTMTGAPKIRAMEIIESIETNRRGLYAGALGVIGAGGYLNLALCIRTLVKDGDAYHCRASAGVVADSDPDREWTETLAKLSAVHWAVTGKELLT